MMTIFVIVYRLGWFTSCFKHAVKCNFHNYDWISQLWQNFTIRQCIARLSRRTVHRKIRVAFFLQYHTVVAGQWPCKTLVIFQCKIHNIKGTFDLHFALMVKSVRWWCVNLSIGIGQTFFHMSLSPCLAVAVAGAPALFAPFVTLLILVLLPLLLFQYLAPSILWLASHKSISAWGSSLGPAICPGVGVAAVRGVIRLWQKDSTIWHLSFYLANDL